MVCVGHTLQCIMAKFTSHEFPTVGADGHSETDPISPVCNQARVLLRQLVSSVKIRMVLIHVLNYSQSGGITNLFYQQITTHY